MNVDVYKSNKSAKYLWVREGKNVSELVVTDVDMTEVSTFKKGLKLDPTKPRIALDQEAAIAAITTDGYYIQGADVITSL